MNVAFIESLLVCFFACHMPQIIYSGKLFRVLPPLYRLNAKKAKSYGMDKNYIFDKAEYNHIYYKTIANSLDLAMVEPRTATQIVKGQGDVHELTKKEKVKMLEMTSRYLDELRTLEKRSFCDADVLENICYLMVMTKDAPAGTFEKLLKKKFPELEYSSEYQSILGSYEGRNISLIIDRIFMRMADRFFRMIEQAPTYYILVKNRNSKDDPRPDDWELMTYGQFLAMCDKTYRIDIEQRYKGIGEGKADMTFPSMMNPKTRRLVRITMDDVDEAMKTLELLHGGTEEMRKARRDLLTNADITLDDIDN